MSDNGRGFALPSNMSELARDGKLGLAGMQERARLIGASLSVESDPGHGTTVTIELPTEVPVKPVPGQGPIGRVTRQTERPALPSSIRFSALAITRKMTLKTVLPLDKTWFGA